MILDPCTELCYCSECDAGDSMSVTFENPGVVQAGGFALCRTHAAELVSVLRLALGFTPSSLVSRDDE